MVTMKNRRLEELVMSDVLNYIHSMREDIPIKLKDYMFTKLMPAYREAVKNYMEMKSATLEKYAKRDEEGNPIRTKDGFDVDPSNPQMLADIAELYDLDCELDIEPFTLKLKTIHEKLCNKLSGQELELLSAVFDIQYC